MTSALDGRVYLDHNATAPLRPEAAAAIADVLARPAGNPSSVHAEGRAARAVVEEARARVAALCGVASGEIVFTSGGSEAIAAAIYGVCEKAPAPRRRIVMSAIEHSAVLAAAAHAERRGYTVIGIPVGSDGRVDPDEFVDRLGTEGTALAILQWANNETGVIQPVREIGQACTRAGAAFFVDAVQAAGRIPLTARAVGAHLMAVSGHKLGGPQGTGALCVREGLSLAPLVPGGAQERRRRGGTEAVALIAGFGAAAEAARAKLSVESARVTRLRARLETRLRSLWRDVRIHGEGAPRLAGTINFSLPGAGGEMLVIALDLAGFAVSSGSACASGAVEPSHVIRAMGASEEEARGALRVSLGWSTTEEDVDRFLRALPDVVAEVRAAGREAPTS